MMSVIICPSPVNIATGILIAKETLIVMMMRSSVCFLLDF